MARPGMARTWRGMAKCGRGVARLGLARQGKGKATNGGFQMDIHISLRGTTPYLMHNIQGVDSELPMVREKDQLTAKKKKMTEADHRQVEELDWLLGLYLEDNVIVTPVRNIKKCFIDAAKITRNGTDVVRALSFRDLFVPLQHSGNGNLAKMYESGAFTSRLAVGIGQKRVMRVRPQFMPWSLEFEAYLFEDALDLDVFQAIVKRAGITTGLGDNRTNGYGRFEARVSVV